jgi:hypothetical protein
LQLPNELLRSVGVHGHVFVNGGTVLPLSGPGAPRSLADVRASLRAAAGAVRSHAERRFSALPSPSVRIG